MCGATGVARRKKWPAQNCGAKCRFALALKSGTAPARLRPPSPSFFLPFRNRRSTQLRGAGAVPEPCSVTLHCSGTAQAPVPRAEPHGCCTALARLGHRQIACRESHILKSKVGKAKSFFPIISNLFK